MGSKSDELTCLNLAISECTKQRGISKKIGLLLAGQNIERVDNERPDFLRYCKSNRKKEKDIVIGIEHFRVDHYSIELSQQRVGSSGIVYEKKLKTVFDTWKPHIDESKQIPDGALSDISNLIGQGLALRIQATYNAFIESFKYSLNKHIRSIDYYHSIIDNYAKNKDKKFAFLIEIHSDFCKLFFHDKNGVHYGENTVPLFDELIRILEKVDSRKVNYLILCFGNTVYNKNPKVIAVPTVNLRNQLAKQHIPVYYYAGDDICLSGFQTPRLDLKSTSEYKRNGDNIDFGVTIESKDIKDETKLEMVISAYKYIKAIECQKKNFATTNLVEMFYQVYDEYCAPFANMKVEDIVKFIPIITISNKDNIELKFEKFKKDWGYNDENKK